MSDREALPEPIPLIAGLPKLVPFVSPDTLQREDGRTFRARLGANESPFGVSPLVRAAAQRSIEEQAWYGDPEALVLRTALAGLHRVAVEQVGVGCGIDDLLGVAVRCFLDRGDVAVTSAGSYPTFDYHVTTYGGRLMRVPYTDELQVDLTSLARTAVEQRARLVYVANPDNPTGSFHPPAAIERLVGRLPAGCLLLLDEAYGDFVSAEQSLAGIRGNVVRLRTFSKAHGLAGLRIGFALAPAQVLAAFDKVRLQFGLGRLAQRCALAALQDEAFRRSVVERTAAGRDDYHDVGRALGYRTRPSSTNFVAFDLGSAGLAAAAQAELRRCGIFVRRPAAPLDRYLRVSVGTREERALFAEALSAFAAGRENERPCAS